jgi:hypothetical protein
VHITKLHLFAWALLFVCQADLYAQKDQLLTEPPRWIDGSGPMITSVSKDRTRVTVYSATTSAFTTVALKEPLPDGVLVTSQPPFVVFRTRDSVYALNDKSTRFAELRLTGPSSNRVYMNENVLTINDDGILWVFGHQATTWSGVNADTGVVYTVDEQGQKTDTIAANKVLHGRSGGQLTLHNQSPAGTP